MPEEHTPITFAAQSILPFLAELTGGNPGDDLTQVVLATLSSTTDPTATESTLVTLLSRHDATRSWMRDYLASIASAGLRDFASLASDGTPLRPSAVFRCPQGGLTWYRRYVGETPPVCPLHQVALERVVDQDPNTGET